MASKFSKELSLFLFFLVFFLLAFFTPPSITAEIATGSQGVIINEIAWMGTESSYNNEWIELYNNNPFDLNLDGWKLMSENGKLKINLKGKIPAEGFFLLERINNKTVSNAKPNLTYKGTLNNKGENLKLVNFQGKISDTVNCSLGWFFGDNQTKRTMERKNPLLSGNNSQNWQNSKNPGGTPKAKNNQERILSKVNKKEEELGGEKITVDYPSNVFISEFLPSPDGPDYKNEWVEISNQNNFNVDISNWQITDTTGKTKVFTFPKKTIINAKNFLVFLRPVTKITLNNSKDGIKLLYPSGKLADKISYKNAPQGKSFNRNNDGWAWSSTLTPGETNIISVPSLKQKPPKKEISIAPSKNSQNGHSFFKKNKELAKIGNNFLKSTNFLFVLIIALTIASFSSLIVLMLKRKLFIS